MAQGDFTQLGGVTLRGLERFVARMLRPLKARIRGIASRAVLSALSDEDGNAQIVQVKLLAGEAADDAERFQDYGFASSPANGAEGVFIAIGADRSHGAVLGLMVRTVRPKLDPGETAMHSTHEQEIRHHKDGNTKATMGALKKFQIGGDVGQSEIPREDLIQAELAKIVAALLTGSNAAGPVIFSAPYVPASTASTTGEVV